MKTSHYVLCWSTLLTTSALLTECRRTLLSDGETTPLIIRFKDAESLHKMEQMCNGVQNQTLTNVTNSGQPCRFTSSRPCRVIFRHVFSGVAGDFTKEELSLLRACIPGGVLYVERDAPVMIAEGPTRSLFANSSLTKEGNTLDLETKLSSPGEKSQDVHIALWNLDRIDQRDLPLDSAYHYGTNTTVGTGIGVNIYLLDSGILPSHREFQEWSGNQSRASYGYDFVDDDEIAQDCDGHGTHVASTAIGRFVGIAKQAKVIGVRVLDCQGSGNISTTVAGLDWVTSNYKKPAIVALSLGVSIGKWSQSLEEAVQELIDIHGISVVVASGNNGVDSCYVAPANVPETITVAASDLETKFGETKEDDKESIYRWSNTGNCVDIFAPGVDIYGACGGLTRCENVTNESYTWSSGTSMAVPHVAGVVALYLGDYPQSTPARVKRMIISRATKGKIVSNLMKKGTPNRIIYSNVMESSFVVANGSQP